MKLRRSTIDLLARLCLRRRGAGMVFGLCTALFATSGQAQSVEWVQSPGGTLGDGGYDVAVDASGNSHVTGVFAGSATFGSFTLTSAGGEYDMFVAKYDSAGNVLWANSAGGTEGESLFGIDIDAAGNSYITGNFQGTATFGPFTLTSAGDWGTFLVKYDAGGNVLWAQLGEGKVWDTVRGIGVDAAGNSYVIGHYFGTATFGPFTLTSVGTYGSWDIFVVKYDTSGNVLWARSGGGTERDVVRGIAVDAAGNSYVAGSFRGTATFGSFTLTTTGDYELFVAKYDAGGSVLRARPAGRIEGGNSHAIAADAAGNSYLVGVFAVTATFGSFTLTGVGNYSIFVVKYDGDGDVLWARSAGAPSEWSSARAIAVDADGICYVTGMFADIATFGPFTLTSAGYFDMFVAEYDGSGNVLWVDSAGGPARTGGAGVGVDAAGNTYVTGTYGEGTASFGSVTLTSAGEEDIFVAKYGPGACCLAEASCVQLGPSDCALAGGAYAGGVCDDDVDGDGLDGACGDPCPYDNPDDRDGDGVCDSDDPCPDDNPDDTDGDGVCDSDDPCPFDNPDDTDGDGVCDSDDACPGFDDGVDADQDGMPDDCDGCPFDPAKNAPGVCGCGVSDDEDADGDGIPDCVDQCPGVDDGAFAPECTDAIPTVSHWGLAILTLLLLTAGKVHFRRRSSDM